MRKVTIFIGILVLAAFIGGFYFSGLTGNVLKGEVSDSYIKTVCSENNQCLDVFVECRDSGVTITPLTGYVTLDPVKYNISNYISC